MVLALCIIFFTLNNKNTDCYDLAQPLMYRFKEIMCHSIACKCAVHVYKHNVN